MKFRFSAAPLLALALGLGTAACSPIVHTRGHMVDSERLAQLQAGKSTADDVLQILGTPTSVGTFDTRSWYYIGQVTERTAFFEPEVVERRVVAIRFESNGVVKEIRDIDKAQGQELELVDRATPTAGHEMGLLEQLLGNVGKFNPASKATRGPTGTTR
ncbi:MAG TPA: outer membrane protein assembly factor BamE [Azospirillaceae bacterium]|nr:outer membrane protein assembly factor BamE [Azospirillaceae bacterium]HRQ79660.1 outer membrane protein assembly factor BamE [Azospirillaceae bacterium]